MGLVISLRPVQMLQSLARLRLLPALLVGRFLNLRAGLLPATALNSTPNQLLQCVLPLSRILVYARGLYPRIASIGHTVLGPHRITVARIAEKRLIT